MRRIFLAAWVLAACGRPGAGEPCTLVKPDGDGGSTPVLESEVWSGRAYFTFGVPECAQGICMRDATFPKPAGAHPTDPAMGYCTVACGTLGAACASADPNLTLFCRPAILDGRPLETTCSGGDAVCAADGGARWPNVCSR